MRRGFTIIEVIIYVALTSVVITFITIFILDTIQTRTKNNVINEVNQEARLVLRRVIEAIENSQSINSPVTSTFAGSLSLKMSTSTIDPTIFDLATGTVRVAEASSTPVSLTSSRITVSDLLFSNVSFGSAQSVRIQGRFKQNNPENLPWFKWILDVDTAATIKHGAAAGVGGGGACAGGRPTKITLKATVNIDNNWANDVAVSGNYAFLAMQRVLKGFAVVNITNPESPSFVTNIDIGGIGRGIIISGNYAFVAVDKPSKGLAVVDISTPTAPVLKKTINVGGSGVDIDASGNTAYMAISFPSKGFATVDIASSTNPSLLTNLNVNGNGQGVDVVGNFAYVGVDSGSNGFAVIDVSTPSTPTFVTSTNIQGSRIRGLHVVNNFAYMATDKNDKGLAIVDVTTSTAPTVKSTIDTNNSSADDVKVDGCIAYVGANAPAKGLSAVDVSVVTDPIYFASVALTPGTDGNGLVVSNNYVYMTTSKTTAGLAVLKIEF